MKYKGAGVHLCACAVHTQYPCTVFLLVEFFVNLGYLVQRLKQKLKRSYYKTVKSPININYFSVQKVCSLSLRLHMGGFKAGVVSIILSTTVH